MLKEMVKEKIRNAVENKENFKIRGTFSELTIVGEFLHSLGIRCTNNSPILPLDYGTRCIYVKHWNPREYIATFSIDDSSWNDSYHNTAGVCNKDIPEIVINMWVPKIGDDITVYDVDFPKFHTTRIFIAMHNGKYICYNDVLGSYESWKNAKPIKSEVEMTIKELEELTGIKNLKIVKEK